LSTVFFAKKSFIFNQKLFIFFSLCFTVETAIDSLLLVGKTEHVVKLLLCCCDATGILTLYNVCKSLGETYKLLLNKNAVTDNIYSRTGCNVADNVKIYRDIRINLNNILFAVLLAVYVLDDCNLAIYVIKPEKLVYTHTLTCVYVVDNKAVDDRIYIHAFASSNSLRISAIRTYLPLSTCLK
jgi:hypothetical protein